MTGSSRLLVCLFALSMPPPSFRISAPIGSAVGVKGLQDESSNPLGDSDGSVEVAGIVDDSECVLCRPSLCSDGLSCVVDDLDVSQGDSLDLAGVDALRCPFPGVLVALHGSSGGSTSDGSPGVGGHVHASGRSGRFSDIALVIVFSNSSSHRPSGSSCRFGLLSGLSELTLVALSVDSASES